VLPCADGPELHRAVDGRKDQSYVLGVLTPEQLERALFPLGDTRKDDVRAEAAARGLALADKPDSHDICFIADGDTRAWLADRLGTQPGEIRGEDGELLGAHDGAYAFTVGQRKGLRIGRPAPDGRPRYVLDVRPVSRTVVVGPAESLDVHDLEADGARWCGPAPVGEVDVRVQVRAHGETVPARARVSGEAVRLTLGEPLRGVAPGQAAVLYDGTRVLGSATIAATSRRVSA
jgi:tRNA-specific 2-thiouridylase